VHWDVAFGAIVIELHVTATDETVGVLLEGPDCVAAFPEQPPQPAAIAGSNPAKSAQFRRLIRQSFIGCRDLAISL
jgi:hypothetical protein